jgi:hypothetical protein
VKKKLFILATIALATFMFNYVPGYSSVCGYEITPSTSTIGFTNTLVGNKSDTTILTITNTSDCNFSLTNLVVSLSGESGEFNIETNTCSGTLVFNANCQVGISFEPSTTGSHSASFTLTTTEATFAGQVTLSGTGTDNTALIIAAASRDDSSGCDATASTGAAGGKSFGPAALGFVAIMCLVLGAVSIRRSTRKRG